MYIVKYDNYYCIGVVNVGDLCWNYQVFQGLVFNGGKLLGGLGFDVFWGKMQLNGGLVNVIIDFVFII